MTHRDSDEDDKNAKSQNAVTSTRPDISLPAPRRACTKAEPPACVRFLGCAEAAGDSYALHGSIGDPHPKGSLCGKACAVGLWARSGRRTSYVLSAPNYFLGISNLSRNPIPESLRNRKYAS